MRINLRAALIFSMTFVALVEQLAPVAQDGIVLVTEIEGTVARPPEFVEVVTKDGETIKEPLSGNKLFIPNDTVFLTFHVRERRGTFHVSGFGHEHWVLRIDKRPFTKESLDSIDNMILKSQKDIEEVWSLDYRSKTEPPLESIFFVEKNPEAFTRITYGDLMQRPAKANGQKVEVRVGYRYRSGWQEIFCLDTKKKDEIRVEIPPDSIQTVRKALDKTPKMEGTLDVTVRGCSFPDCPIRIAKNH